VGGITFSALEPVDADHPLTVTVSLPPPTSPPGSALTGDITVTYGKGAGSRVETFRKVSVDPADNLIDPVTHAPKSSNYANYITRRIGFITPGQPADPANFVSTIVAVDPTTLPNPLTAGGPTPMPPWPPSDAVINPATDFLNPITYPTNLPAIFATDSSLDKVPVFNLMYLPGIVDNGILSEAVSFCEQKEAFLIMDCRLKDGVSPTDPASSYVGDYIGVVPHSKNAALYFPYLKSEHPATGAAIEIPPGGTVAGIFSRTDQNRGVWKAPAGLETTVINVTEVVDRGKMSDPRQGVLNGLGVNCLRQFPSIGTVVFGARTVVSPNPSQQDWKYVPVRRMALFLEQTLYNNLGWVVFEPNAEPLWTSIKTSIEAFMLSLFRQGALAGDTASQAFQVKCDNQTTTQTDIDNGVVNIVVAFAPLKPAEFVIIQITQLAGQAQSAA
jgi:hypothetical protein